MAESKVQVKLWIDSGILSDFKECCVSREVSMSSAVGQLMQAMQPSKSKPIAIKTRPQRRKAVARYTGLLEELLQEEEQYRDAIPEQFESRHEAADHSCEQLMQAISCLEDAY